MKVLQKNGEMAEMSFEEQEGRKAFWHTSAHVLAQAVKHLYPDTKCAIGPAIENGFYYDFELIEGLIHRNEKSVTLHGPMRARCFMQDDAHIFMWEDQVMEEIQGVMKLIDEVYQRFGFTYEIELSTRPEKSIGTDEEWTLATKALEETAKGMNKPYAINEGDGAFYGPKLDFHLKDSIGRAGIELPFEKAAAIDLAGRDVLEAVKMSVNPKVIETTNVSAVAKDGIELLVKARVTVRADLERLVGGAGEATILARIGEGIVTTVGSAQSHKEVLENPDDISKRVLSKGLDSGTAFEILSIDIADIDVGRNIGAQLQSLQAEADKNIAQAKAEERRAMAVAKEQEMRAYVVEAEAEVPKALAYALREGKMGVMDYYELQNLKADTDMRSSISGAGSIDVDLTGDGRND